MIETVKMLHKHDPYIQKVMSVQIFETLNQQGVLEIDIDISVTISKLVESDTWMKPDKEKMQKFV